MTVTRILGFPFLLLSTAATGTLVLGAPAGGRPQRVRDAKVPEGIDPVRRVKARKSSKSPKSHKSHKGCVANDPDRLIAFLAPAPGYEGGFKPLGTVTATYNPDGAFLLTLAAQGLDPSCDDDAACRMTITKSTTCTAPLGANPADPDYYLGEDPWGEVTFDVDTDGFSSSASRVNNGYALKDNLGHAVVVRRGDDWIGCGVFVKASSTVNRDVYLRAAMGRYPGFDGSLAVSGTVTVAYRTDDTFKFEYDLAGVEADCETCGVHIHSGTSCATHEQVLGHEWNSGMVQDLWTPAGGATYHADDDRAEGHFSLYNGFGYGRNLAHAVVVHAKNGTRVGCGVLEGIVA